MSKCVFCLLCFFFRWKIVIWRVFCGGYWGKSKGRKNEKIFLLEILRTLRATPDLLDPQHFGFWIRDPDPDPRCKISTQTCKRNNLLPAPKSELLRGYENVLYGWYKYHKKKKNILKILLFLKKKNQQILKKCSWHLDPDPDSFFFMADAESGYEFPLKWNG